MNRYVIILAIFCTLGCNSPKAIPEEKNGVFEIKIENLLLETDPRIGGRITSLKIDGENFFTGKDVNANYWGSTFWPSPQNSWKEGTVPPELDNQPYSVQVQNDVIKMVSEKDSTFGYVFTKEISGDVKSKSFTIKYTIANQSDKTQKIAPWEVTRVHTKGITFYPAGTGERRGNIANLAEDKDGITWFTYEEDTIPVQHNKFFADGSEGWIAQVNGDVLFVKKFPDIMADKAAPSEAEIEVYANPDKSYVEVEQQGEYKELQTGDTLIWEVKWFLRRLPPDIKPESGNPALVSYVRDLVFAQ